MRPIVEDIVGREQELVDMEDGSPRRSERQRAHILLVLARSGLSQRGVARALGHAPSYVNETVKRFREAGVEGLRERRGGQNTMPRRDEVLALLPKLTTKQPSDFGWSRSTWSVETVAREVERQLAVTVSRPHMGRLLKLVGCRRVRPKPTIALAPEDHAEQIARLNEELAIIGEDDVILYADEVDIHLNPKVGPDWTPRGLRKEVVTPGKNCKHFVAGAYQPATDELITVDGPSKNSLLFIALLHALAARFADRGTVHLVVDNYIIHKSKLTQRAVEKLQGKVRLHFLPPYCPNYNPIERVWWDLHAHVTRNHRHRTIDELMAAVRDYVIRYDLAGAKAASLCCIAI
ncbi:MAG: IS630 family transposase [Planctomycetota bacterium]